MKDRSIRRLASAGLAIGGILGMAGTLASSSSLRGLAWAGVPPPEAFTVLPIERDGPRITPYLAYQTEMAWRQDDQTASALRRAPYRAGPAAAAGRASPRRCSRMIGGLPAERTPLNARITGADADGRLPHREARLREPARHVRDRAACTCPKAEPPQRPAVLVPCGHSPNGKAYYQALCQRLVRRGYVVICWDPVGQGERSQFWDAPAGRSRYNLICGEHAVLGNLAYLAGTNLARWEVWDGMRALDYLLTRPEVDPARISITGTSGGGFQAAIIGALDTRIRVVAPSCYITALPMRVANRIFKDPDSDPEQDPTACIADGVDHAGLLLLDVSAAGVRRGCRPGLLSDRGHAEDVSRDRRHLPPRSATPTAIAMTEGYHEHEFSVENQARAFAFLDRFNGMPAGRAAARRPALDGCAAPVHAVLARC